MALIDLPPGGISLDDIRKAAIVQALARSGWNQTKAAKLLRIGRKALWHAIQRYQIHPPNDHWPFSTSEKSVCTFKRRVYPQKLTKSDVDIIRAESSRLRRMPLWKRAQRIAEAAKGMLGSAGHIQEIIRKQVRING